MSKVKKILGISSLLSYGNKKDNNILFSIAQKLNNMGKVHIDMLFPNPHVPFFLRITNHFKRFLGFKKVFYNEGIKTEKFTYITLPRHTMKSVFRTVSIILQKNKLKKYGKYDLIHAHFALWSIEGLIARYMNKWHGIPYIVSIRGTDIKGGVKKNKILDNASAIHIPSPWMKKHIPSSYHNKIKIITHGIDVPDYSNQIKEKTILVVSKFVKNKNIDWTINAYKNIIQQNEGRMLKIIGGGYEEEKLKELARGRNDIKFLGKVPHDQVIEEMKKSQIFSMPSVNETFGLVYLEAMATKNIVIATKGTGIDGLFINQEEVVYVEPKQEEYEEIFGEVVNNVNRYMIIGENAYKSVLMNYNRKKIINKYISIYQRY